MHYECCCCGESHPFNIYCPNVRDPPIIPGECRSCGTTTREHASDCQYVAIKDNIGLCTYCRALSHRYADCPQRIADHERSTREKKNNKRNNKKKGKVRIIAGIMTREQDSDSTLPPEGKEREMGILSCAVPFTYLIVGMQMSREWRDPTRLETSVSLHVSEDQGKSDQLEAVNRGE